MSVPPETTSLPSGLNATAETKPSIFIPNGLPVGGSSATLAASDPARHTITIRTRCVFTSELLFALASGADSTLGQCLRQLLPPRLRHERFGQGQFLEALEVLQVFEPYVRHPRPRQVQRLQALELLQ